MNGQREDVVTIFPDFKGDGEHLGLAGRSPAG
jgi:hypothetical protein